MKNKHLLLPALVLLAGLLVFFACNKKDNTPTYGGLPADQTVTASVQGRVLDESGLPVKGAAVTSGTSSTTTDVNGVFSFSNISMSSRFGFVKVTKTGYFTGSRSIITAAGGSNYITINLLPRTAKGSFAVAGGGAVVVQTGDTVTFGAGAVVTASTNAAYSGTVHVYAAYLDPTDADLSKHMPGDLRGIGTDGKETALQTFGMMVVELDGDAGEKLQIASGKTATISMAIPASLQGAAPATIPLWYFNDTTGKWIQQGTATRVGNNYTGQVAHFSYWNCDAPMGTVNFTVKLKDQNGNPLAFTPIQFVSQTAGTRGGITDANGAASGLIPKGQTLQFQVLSPCGTVIFGESLGAAIQDQDLGTLTVTSEGASLRLSGTVVDCSSSPVANGFVNVLVDGLNYRSAVTNGSFSLTVFRCSVSAVQATLTAGDYGTLQQGASTQLTVDTGAVKAGQLSACGTSLDQYITLSFNGNTYNITVPPDSIGYYNSGSSTLIYATSPAGVTPFQSLNFAVDNLTGTGTYNTGWFFLTEGTSNYTQQGNTSVQLTVTNYAAAAGQYLQGSISGSIKDTTSSNTPGNNYNITGSFKIKR